MNAEKITLQKRAVYTGLKPHLTHDQLMEALVLWERNYEARPDLSLRYYVAEVSERFKCKPKLNRIFVSINRSMRLRESELLPDPQSILKAYKSRHNLNKASPVTAMELEAFQMLIAKYINLNKDHPRIGDVIRYVIDELPKTKVDKYLKQELNGWLLKKIKKIQLYSVKSSDLRSLLNLLYIGFCTHLGPVEADAGLAEAIQRLKSNGGGRYSEIFTKFM
ncbi:MAG: hypothetical protein KTR17_06440 [Cellvibrionaceae bacterium]|nr:hypothetical protein [Cellvibrionaceae bacterium]